MRPYQTTYYFALHKIFTPYTSLRKGPCLVPSPQQAKIQCHTPNYLTTISRDHTKYHVILRYTKYLHIIRVLSRGPYLVPGPNQANKQCHTPNFLTTISRDHYQISCYFALHKIFTSYTSLRSGPYLVPGPNQAKKQGHTPHFITTISRDPTKQHIILHYTKYLHLTRVLGGVPIWFLVQIKLTNSDTHFIF